MKLLLIARKGLAKGQCCSVYKNEPFIFMYDFSKNRWQGRYSSPSLKINGTVDSKETMSFTLDPFQDIFSTLYLLNKAIVCFILELYLDGPSVTGRKALKYARNFVFSNVSTLVTVSAVAYFAIIFLAAVKFFLSVLCGESPLAPLQGVCRYL